MITSGTNQSRYIPRISEEMFILEKLKERVANLNPEIDTEWVSILEKEVGGFGEFELLGGILFQLVYSYSEDRFIVKSKHLNIYNSLFPKGKVTENNKYYCKLFDDVIIEADIPYYFVYEWENSVDKQIESFKYKIKTLELNIKESLLKTPKNDFIGLELKGFHLSGVEIQKSETTISQKILKELKRETRRQIECFLTLSESPYYKTHWFAYDLIAFCDFNHLSVTDKEDLTEFIIRTCLELMKEREVNSNSILKLLDTNLLSLDSLYVIFQNSTFNKLKVNEKFLINKITRDLKDRFSAGTITEEEIKFIMKVLFHKTSFAEKRKLLKLMDNNGLDFLKEHNLISLTRSTSLKLLLWLSR